MVLKNNSFSQEQAIKEEETKLSGFFSLPFQIFDRGKKNVNVLNLKGIIGSLGIGKKGMDLYSLNDLIEKAFETKKLAAVCLNINSPGGSPVQSELIAKRIMQLSEEKDVPVYSFVEDMAASGGYWLACAGHEIYASKSSIIGSIGVITKGFGLSKVIEKWGIERRVYAQGNNKSILDPFVDEKEEDLKILTKAQENIYHHFVEYVKSRRRGRLTQSDDFLFNGAFWCGQNALDYGLIDGIDDLYSFIYKKFGKNANIKHVKTKESFFKKLLSFELSTKVNTDEMLHNIKEEILSQNNIYFS